MLTPAVLSAFMLAPAPAAAALLFTFDYSENATDNPGVGFLDPVLGAARQAALTEAGIRFSSLFGQHFSNSASLVFIVDSFADASNPTLASAGTLGAPAATDGFGLGEVVRRKILEGTDPNGSDVDGFVNVNFGVNWELDPATPAVPEGGPGTPSFDFYAALFHEFTHALGFGSNIGPSSTGTGVWSKWDQYLTDCRGASPTNAPLVDQTTLEVNTTARDNAITNGGCFSGPNAVAAYGRPIELFENVDQSHLDDNIFRTPVASKDYMMNPFRAPGPQEERVWDPIEIGIMEDLGYTRVGAVPEPSSALLLLAAAAGFVAVRRRASRA